MTRSQETTSRYERKKEPHGYIANTDPLDRPGHHWLVLWTHSGNVGEVMDICALQNNRATARLVKRSMIICDLKRTVFAIDLQFSNIHLTVPCCFYSIVFGNFWFALVLLTIGSLAADESFPVNFILFFMPGFKNRDVLCLPLFLPSQDSLSVLCIISFMVGTPTNDLLVVLQYMTGAIHLVWHHTNDE